VEFDFCKTTLKTLCRDKNTPDVATRPPRARAPSRLAGGPSRKGELSEDRGTASSCGRLVTGFESGSCLTLIEGF
jgi:hypothetical protein